MTAQFVDKEITIPGNTQLVTITDTEGIIVYVNKAFSDISEYEEEELVGSNHNIVRHPDMPKAIFKMLWERIKKGDENIRAVIKNLTKSGKYYWITALFSTKKDDNGNVINHRAQAVPTSKNTVKLLNPLYDTMIKIEEKSGVEASLTFFHSFLEDRKISYDKLDDENIAKLSKRKGGDNEGGFFEKLFS